MADDNSTATGNGSDTIYCPWRIKKRLVGRAKRHNRTPAREIETMLDELGEAKEPSGSPHEPLFENPGSSRTA